MQSRLGGSHLPSRLKKKKKKEKKPQNSKTTAAFLGKMTRHRFGLFALRIAVVLCCFYLTFARSSTRGLPCSCPI
jgi:hypothetical protein